MVDRSFINQKGADMGEDFVAKSQNKGLASDDVIAATLNDFFAELKGVNAEFGYRSAMEIYQFVCMAQINDDTDHKLSMDEMLDCAVVQKMLPKLHGSRKKLDAVLQALWKKCMASDEAKACGNISKENVDRAKYRLAADKIQRMYQAAYDNGFTSFAEA
jgi:5-methylcytosine-specific restriction protein B